jgi:hypothetical protein
MRYVVDFIKESCDTGIRVYDDTDTCIAVHVADIKDKTVESILRNLDVKDEDEIIDFRHG